MLSTDMRLLALAKGLTLDFKSKGLELYSTYCHSPILLHKMKFMVASTLHMIFQPNIE